MIRSLQVVAGAQFGSEAKGHVTHRVIRQLLEAHKSPKSPESPGQTVNVRVAGPNAGHTVIDYQGTAWPMRQIPVGFVDPDTQLVIAPGSEVDPTVLTAEIEAVEAAGYQVRHRLWIDPAATVLTPDHIEAERRSAINSRLGSTAKGIGAARVDRLNRTAETIGDYDTMFGRWGQVSPFPYTETDDVVVEGTQGYGLGLHTEYYPKTTSSDCRAIDFLAMAGLMPWDTKYLRIWLVARMFPIRVAGNSGPLLGETSWDQLDLPAEQTTVTKKTRRVGAWDPDLVAAAVKANGTRVVLALTMLDQRFPQLRGVSDSKLLADIVNTDGEVVAFLSMVEEQTGARVAMLTNGPDTGTML